MYPSATHPTHPPKKLSWIIYYPTKYTYYSGTRCGTVKSLQKFQLESIYIATLSSQWMVPQLGYLHHVFFGKTYILQLHADCNWRTITCHLLCNDDRWIYEIHKLLSVDLISGHFLTLCKMVASDETNEYNHIKEDSKTGNSAMFQIMICKIKICEI